ncbi:MULTISPECIES: nicotinate-nucleotide adenylyltransferase [Neisseria]|uniref:Probable nicotinate-nucleotide adenylyltransferase n=1 Tax=Neisseria musculi TaxID=1815583 RepID=A0A7H1MAU1_9NEIS|nr:MULTISPECIES: nicotinate-nucleotide adenylyltransferase [Neisseria]MBF0804015.1 nicotinate (nicotinamide) nucleotide adenylyltransferase [Neisseria sp. 19428wB4_WF04]QNT58756.1 nicotinate (nicotinamide) nucleotide adenylyltransferase [Neisseria musculi]TFU43283.1 nicotinate (nicotinamide) nucleotide adenylyltransferase [Neisseria sp. WF04]
MKNIGLFGGTFDPPHNGHLHIARAFANELNLDMAVFLPAGDPYHKTANTRTPAKHRLAMTELAACADSRFAVSDCDIVRKGATYTFDTIQIFRQQFPTARLWWLIGSDNLLQLHTWKKWQTLVKQTHMAVAVRTGGSLAQVPRELQSWLGQALQKGSLQLLQAPPCNISSTEIRRRLRHSESTAGMIDTQVAAYIARHNLYR